MSQAIALSCPRCGDQLETSPGGSALHRCASCEGTLIRQNALQTLLRKLAEGLGEDNSDGGEIPAIPDKGKGLRCPECGRAMENYGFLATNKVQIDCCHTCLLLWADVDELKVMAQLHARSIAAFDQHLDERANADDEDAHLQMVSKIRRSFRRRTR